MAYRLVRGLPERRRRLRAGEEFDELHGVDTAGLVGLTDVEVDGPSVAFGRRYEGVDPLSLRALLDGAPIADGEMTFVDLGAGKGRALLLASEYPFARIVGVEFVPAFADIARDNAGRFASERRQCAEIDVVCGDAAEFDVPDGPLFIYSYNSFAEPVVREVLSRLRRSLDAHPRQALLAFVCREFPESLLLDAGFRAVHSTGGELYAAITPPG